MSLIFKNTTKENEVIAESTSAEQLSTFIRTLGFSYNWFMDALFKNFPPPNIRSQDGKL